MLAMQPSVYSPCCNYTGTMTGSFICHKGVTHRQHVYHGDITPLPIIKTNFHANVMPLQTHYLCIASRANPEWAVCPSITPNILPRCRYNSIPLYTFYHPHSPPVHSCNIHPDKYYIASGLHPIVHCLVL